MGERVCALEGCGKAIPEERGPRAKYCSKSHRRQAIDQAPERKAKERARRQSPEYKAYERARQQTPEYRAQWRALSRTPKRRAADRARNQTPERKATNRAKQKAYEARKKAAARLAREEQQVAGVVEAIRGGLRRPDLLPLFCDGIHEVLLVERVIGAEQSKRAQ